MKVQIQENIDRDLLQAVLLHSDHRFDESISLLGQVLETAPAHPQALLLKTALLRIKGRYAEAETCARKLASIQPGLVANACVADLRSLQGDRNAFSVLRRHVQQLQLPHEHLYSDRDASTDSLAGVGGWLHALLAEMADRIGSQPAAEANFRLALQNGGGTHARVAFANWLIDHRRPDEAMGLLQSGGADCIDAPDSMLIVYAIAHRQARLDACVPSIYPTLVERLRERFAHADRRGTRAQSRERAAFELDVENNPQEACEHALANWSLQKEPADARLLARAAIAAFRVDAIAALETDVAQNGLSDCRLDALLTRAKVLGLGKASSNASCMSSTSIASTAAHCVG